MVDTADSNSVEVTHVGSNPTLGIGIPSIENLDSLPSSVRYSRNALNIWRHMETLARATLLVHGSEALTHVRDAIDPKLIITKMVEAGTLIPCKVDLAGADHSAKAFAGLTYGDGTRYITRHEWCTAFALFWTYEPGNRNPVRID